MAEFLWSEQDTGPGRIEAALRDLLKQSAAEGAFVPARVLNLIAIVDREWRGEIENRLERVGRYHPSRTVICSIEPGRTQLDAVAYLSGPDAKKPGELAVGSETVVVDCGPGHVPRLDSLVDALVVPDLPTVAWSPHRHPEAIDAVLSLVQVVLLDSIEEPSLTEAVTRAEQLAGSAYVVDLAWLRSTPWRERIAATFDPPLWRAELGRLAKITVRHHPDSAMAALLLFGWLCSRLGWQPGSLIQQNGSLRGRASARRHEVELCLEPDAHQAAPGLAGLQIETASGMSLSLDRGPGGLAARRTSRDGREATWTVLGASRGEAGILGEGIRQALLREPTYGPALEAAGAMVR
ncbi:MAG TPA: glucose-6-phosphate dehydrogenase assembly protein OpcA [Thermoleophilaceae bacterium]|nr:glucose-6-phosphate dehydrogenase assembly protein OpcA [Thermoleophilaceae bacterium]